MEEGAKGSVRHSSCGREHWHTMVTFPDSIAHEFVEALIHIHDAIDLPVLGGSGRRGILQYNT